MKMSGQSLETGRGETHVERRSKGRSRVEDVQIDGSCCVRTVTGGRGTTDGGGLSGWFGDDKHSGEGGEGGVCSTTERTVVGGGRTVARARETREGEMAGLSPVTSHNVTLP